jgi:hypothetical protein
LVSDYLQLLPGRHRRSAIAPAFGVCSHHHNLAAAADAEIVKQLIMKYLGG